MNFPSLRPVASSAIRSVGYVPLAPEFRKVLAGAADGLTFIKFASGGTWAYLTPSWLYGLLRASRSTGRGFHALIRGRYPAVRVRREECINESRALHQAWGEPDAQEREAWDRLNASIKAQAQAHIRLDNYVTRRFRELETRIARLEAGNYPQ